MTEKIPIDIIAPCVAKLRTLRPDDNISGFDAFDDFLIRERTMSDAHKHFLSEMDELFSSFWRIGNGCCESFLRDWEEVPASTDELLVFYLAHLDQYFGDAFMMNEQKTIRKYHTLWEPELLCRFSSDQMLLIHWSVAKNQKSHVPHPPMKLLEFFLLSEDLIPLCYRRWYVSLYGKFMRMKKADQGKSFRTEARGDFNCYHDRWGKKSLPEALKQAIQQDSVGATEINLSLLNKKWSAGIFGYAYDHNAVKILCHMIHGLTPDAKSFSCYDAIINIISHRIIKPPRDPRKILRLFEEERPGILRAYRDPYGNTLLRIVQDLAWRNSGQAKLYRDFLLEYNCDPDEPNALGISYRNSSYYLTGQF